MRAVLLEELYRRCDANFNPTTAYVTNEAQVLRIGVNADI